MYFRAHAYHWNVEGLNFNDYHGYFGGLYDELFGAVDPLAEHIRTAGGYAPVSVANLIAAKTVSEDTAVVKDYKEMFRNLSNDNDTVIDSLKKAYDLAESEKMFGLMHFLSDRIDTHAKHKWQLQSFLK
jgi:starvation-inducible DNA-binding protein